MRDFTLSRYGQLVDHLKQHVGGLCGVLHWHRAKPETGVLIRHDVDRKPANAVAMARLEADKGVFTTYYFRVVGSAWNPDAIREIARLGHEVGYHYEDLALAGGDVARAHALFGEHLGWLRALATIQTATMHGSPLSRHNNLALWERGSPADYQLEADAFLSVDYAGVPYFTDTGRSWAAGATNLRDKPATAAPSPAEVQSTGDLMDYVTRTKPRRLALSAHPERWAHAGADWWMQLGKDSAANAVKRILRAVR